MVDEISVLKDGRVYFVQLEEYVADVLALEAPEDWPLEALLANAVAIRSFAVYSRSHPRHSQAALCATAHCQLWKKEAAVDITRFAAHLTRNEILVYGGKVIEAVYSAVCGGRTRSSEEVWGTFRPYLQSVDCVCDTEQFGHGVGLCQLGAKLMAESGKSYEEILSYYYTGAELASLKEPSRDLRFGLHSIHPDGIVPFVKEALRRGVSFSVCKCVDDIGPLREIKELSKDIVTIGRFTGRDVPSMEGDEEEIAKGIMNWLLYERKALVHKDYVDYWEIVNEPSWPDVERHKKLARVSIKCMEIAERNGVRLALFSYSYGNPKIEFWPEIIATGVFKKAKKGGHILSLHEGCPGQELSDEGVVPWLCHRYNFLYDLLSFDERIPLVITEFTFGDVHKYGLERWAEQLKLYASAFPDFVLGVTPFTLGPTADWKALDYYDVVPLLIERMVEYKEEGEEEEGKEEVGFLRHFVLFPQGSPFEWVQASAKYLEKYRITCGQSVDDAICRLPERQVITVINPNEELLDFLRIEPEVETRLDIVRARSPQELKEIFDWRAESGNRFGFPEAEEKRRGLVGLHLRNDYNLKRRDFDMIKEARIEAVKFLSFTDTKDFIRIKEIEKDIFGLTRLYSFSLAERRISPEEFVNEISAQIQGWLDVGLSYFEIHNEPNWDAYYLSIWEGPEDFALWYLEVLERLKALFSQENPKWGFPGLSPPLGDLEWLDACKDVIKLSDWLGCHCYWRNEEELRSREYGRRYEIYKERFPDLPLIITECSNPVQGPVPEQYLEFYETVLRYGKVIASMSFIQSSHDERWWKEAWRREDGSFKPIVEAIGRRTFS